MVRLISMAMTGYYRTMQRPRVHQPLSMLKYDPIGTLRANYGSWKVEVEMNVCNLGMNMS
jgi:hypothetical protein